MELEESEAKYITLILAFHTLERAILRQGVARRPRRVKRLLKKKWRKVLPLLDPGSLQLKEAGAEEVRTSSHILLLYARLYSDTIDDAALQPCRMCIEKLSAQGVVAMLSEDLVERIEGLLVRHRAGGEGGRGRAEKRPAPAVFPHLSSDVRARLVRYFHKKLREEEPVLMLDPALKLRIDRLLRRRVDRIIDVTLEHAYRALQYGYVGRDSEELSRYVEKRAREAIEWSVEKGLILQEVAETLSR